jgi:hypothetical protein
MTGKKVENKDGVDNPQYTNSYVIRGYLRVTRERPQTGREAVWLSGL